MGDSWRSSTARRAGTTYRTKLAVLLLLSAAIAVGLTIGGASVGGAPVSTDEANETDEAGEAIEGGEADDGVVIHGECVDDAGTLAIENPTATAVNVTMNWSVEQSAIELRIVSENATQTMVLGGATVDAEQEVSVNGDERTVAVEFEPGLLNVTIPADENLTIAGLADDTYEFSATAAEGTTADDEEQATDEAEVPIEPDTVTVDCSGSDTGDGNGIHDATDE